MIKSAQPGERPLGHPPGLILFVLGAARVPPELPLPGAALLALLDELGLSEPAARSAVLRMRRGGWLDSHRNGRSVSYAPAPRMLAGHRRRAGTLTASTAEWDRSFHALLVSVPEHVRAFRDELRRAAHIAGYRTLRAGLLIAPSDRREELGDILDRVPPQASVMSGQLELGRDDTRRVAGELWALDELGQRYRSLITLVRAAAGSARAGYPSGRDAFRAFAAATLPIYEAVAEDPGLPTELLPAGWSAQDLSNALDEALYAFGPVITAHIADLRHQAAGGITKRSTAPP